MWGSLLSGIGAIGQSINSHVDTGLTSYFNSKNLKLQKKAFEEQKWLNRQMLDRNDNQLQYMRRDAEKANINPIAAMGGSYSVPASSAGAAPQYDTASLQNAIQSFSPMEVASAFQDIITARSAENLNSANALKAVAETENIKTGNDLILQQISNLEREIKSKDYNLHYSNRYNQPYGYGINPYHLLSTQAIKTVEDNISSSSGFGNKVLQGIKDVWKGLTDPKEIKKFELKQSLKRQREKNKAGRDYFYMQAD